MDSNTHILIIDDVVDNIQVAMNILKEDGYDFSFATQGAEALALIEQASIKFDLILLDIMMPGIDGFGVCQMLQNDPQTKEIPIIFLTAKVDIDSVSKGFTLGAVDYITKPFHAEELLARVRTHLDLYHAKKLLQANNIALKTKAKYEKKRLLSELEDNQKEMIWILTDLMSATSNNTGQHIRRIAEISLLLAQQHPTLSHEDAEVIFHASPMYGIGKMTLPHEVIHKSGKYTEEEFKLLKTHTTSAYNLLNKSKRELIQSAAVIAHEYREQWDGQGYPRKLKGESIHIYARIVSLAVVFEALTHDRSYREAWSMDKIVDYVSDNRGIQFDPQLVDIFIEHLDKFKQLSQLK